MVTKKINALRSLKKSRHILSQIYRIYKRKAPLLEESEKLRLQTHMNSLRTAILQKEAEHAQRMAELLEEISHRLLAKTPWDKIRDSIFAIGSALIIALIIRLMWFEPYTVPTGSMRPTIKEHDFLFVSKTDYGINVPLSASHFYFDPSLVKRGSIVVFTGKNMDIDDVDTMYFYLFPGKKMFVKRLIGKPGDTLYFYGGEIYGINAQGDELTELRDPKWFGNLEHIPFIRFDGKVETPTPPSPSTYGAFSPAIIYQMNQPVAKLSLSLGKPVGEMIAKSGTNPLSHYSDLWGYKHYAMARLLTQEQLEAIHPKSLRDIESAPLYLELSHHPSIQEARLIRDEHNRLRPDIGYSVSLLPLSKEAIEKIGSSMTTCRFIVKNGVAYRHGQDPKNTSLKAYYPRLSKVPDGTYEFQAGQASRVLTGGVTQPLEADHPLYDKSPEHIQFLYNLGIEMLNFYTPSKNSRAHPSRYAYFREGDLYLLGAPILKKGDPALIRFLQHEYQKQSISTSIHPYFPFDDAGPPLTKDGKIDVEFLKKYGLTVPEKSYLVLGDNHAMSGDSRVFGFVPQDNLRGSPHFLFWPPGSRWGALPQPPHSYLTLPTLIVWSSALLITLGYSYYLRRKIKKPFNF